MDDNTELDALLEEEHAPWEAVSDLEAGSAIPPEIRLKELFCNHPDEVIRQLQLHGVTKLGEFKEKSTIVFPAFKESSLITLGSSHRLINYEATWRDELHRLAQKHKKKTKDKGNKNDSGWTADVIVEAFVVNVAEAADPASNGLIQPLLKRWQVEGCPLAVFGLPAVQATIHFKWNTFCKRFLLWQLGIFLTWLLSFSLFTFFFQDEDLSLSLTQLMKTPSGFITVVVELISITAMVPFLALEPATIAEYGFWGWLSIWNALDLSTYILQGSISFCHLFRVGLTGNALSIMMALQSIFLLFRLQYYSRVFKSTRFSFLDAIRDVIYEIRHYFVFLLIIMFGFSQAFYIIFRNDQAVTFFDTVPHAFLKIYSSQGGLSYEEMLGSHVPVAASLLNVAYSFVMGMVLVNLLIGLMGNALAKQTEHEALKMLLFKAYIIDEVEATLGPLLEKHFGKWSPDYIHVLRIDPDRVEKVDLSSLWENGGGNGKKNGVKESSSEVLAQKLDSIENSIAVLTAEMQKLLQQQGRGGGSGAMSVPVPSTPGVVVLSTTGLDVA